jgi:hypothetical protein
VKFGRAPFAKRRKPSTNLRFSGLSCAAEQWCAVTTPSAGSPNAVQDVVVRDIAQADEPDAGVVQFAPGELPHQDGADAGGDEGEERIPRRVPRALQGRREVRVLQRRAQALHDLPARFREPGPQPGLGVDARPVVRHQRRQLADTVARRPFGEDGRGLRDGDGGPRDGRRLFGDRGGGGRHDDLRHLRARRSGAPPGRGA